jgi:two-component system nitrate/nitrite sensor histidine kinase NarX
VIELDDQLPPGLLSPNEEVHVLQIVREALSNTTRHARARRVQVRLDADPESVRVEVCDDGCGMDSAAQRRGHYGLSIMRERASSLGGELRVASRRGQGTCVLLHFRPRLRRPATPTAGETLPAGAVAGRRPPSSQHPAGRNAAAAQPAADQTAAESSA